MCDYCERIYAENGSGRKFGKFFENPLNYTGEIQLSWRIENGTKIDYELYMNDDVHVCDISVPICYCPKCGRKLD